MPKELIIFMPSIEGGGVEKNLFIISKYLSRYIKNISIITLSKQYKKKFNKEINFLTLKNDFWDKIGRRKKFIISLFILLIEIIKRKRNVLIFCFQGNIYCTLLCKLLGIKIIVRSNSAPDGWSQNFIKFFFFKYIFKLADKVLVNSYDFKKKFKRKFNIKTECIYNPLNFNEIIKKSKIKTKYKFPKSDLKIINIGRFTDQKDQITLLKALNIIKKKVNFFLYIMGRGVEKNNLEKYIKKNNLKKNVKIINFQNNPFCLLKKSELFVLSSIYEGLPNVLLESIVLKKYVISSNCPTGPREILLNGKGGSLFKPKNYKQLANQIYEYSLKKKKFKKKIDYAYKNLDRFDYKINLKKYLNVVQELM
jgi:glycosyltransferase involved in cell wall biosynthesis